MAVSPEPDEEQDGIIGAAPDLLGGLVDRGIGFQAAGFAVVLLASTTILRVFQGSEFWLYQWFEIAVTGTYWAAVAPLAALFDWMRKMFERGKAIREAKKAEILAKERRKGREEGREEGQAEGLAKGVELVREREKEIQTLLKSPGVTLPPEIADAIFGDAAKNGS